MKASFTTINPEYFSVKEGKIAGDAVFLVNPREEGTKWDQENKIFRSSIWDAKGNPVSLGFPKFTNWGENPEHFPVPSSLDGCKLLAKVDGSLLIISKYKGEFILRTRGSFNLDHFENAKEAHSFFNNNPSLRCLFSDNDTWDFSLLFEWTSPTNRIVCEYGDAPTFTLIGGVSHSGYQLFTQSELDLLAKILELRRPKVYSFDNIESLLSEIETWENEEGICVYSPCGQHIWKCKCSWYLKLHRFKSNATLKNTIDLFFQFEKPSYEQFEKILVNAFDYECFQMVKEHALKVTKAWTELMSTIDKVRDFVTTLLPLENRKLQAEQIISKYSAVGLTGVAFSLLSGKVLTEKQLRDLLDTKIV